MSESKANFNGEELRGKRVAVVVYSHYPSDPRPRREAETLAQQGMQVDVICIKQTEEDLGRDFINGVNILRVPIQHRRGGKLGYVLQYLSFILAAFFVLAFRSVTRRYDLVHVHNMPDVLVFAALIPKVRGAKILLDLHDPMPELMMTIFGLKSESFSLHLMKQFEKWSIRFSDMVLTPNIAFAKLFTTRSCPADKMQVVMNSPDESIFQYRESRQEISKKRNLAKHFIIMYHGALVERHGLDLAVRAVEELRLWVSCAQLHVFGRPTPFLDHVMTMVQARGLEDVVVYGGAKKLDEIVAAIDRCDVGIIPNRQSVFTEINMPTRIFEYLARAKPTIVPRTTGIEDYFKPEEIIFFKTGDPNDLARKLHHAYSEPEEVAEIIRRGQAIYRAHCWNKERLRFTKLVRRTLVGLDQPTPVDGGNSIRTVQTTKRPFS